MPNRPVILLVLLLAVAAPARAWDDVGHEVVAYIAWEHMTPEAREAVVELMRRASWGSGLPQLLPQTGAAGARARTLFMRASTWPDLVRSRDEPARQARYHRSNWHYINYFWEEHAGAPRDRDDLRPAGTNAVERLERLAALVRDETLPRAQRGIYAAWILHLVGDLHQPLHTSARVTAAEPEGDRGGNLFGLGGSATLHGYWDGILRRSVERRSREGDAAYVARIARAIVAAHPPSGEGRPDAYAEWALEGFETAKRDVYRADLERGRTPPESYRRHAYEVAAPAVARAGYRLAALLNHLFA